MSVFTTLIKSIEFNRTRTLGLLDKIEKDPQGSVALGWRPGPGRAHIAWQLMHVAVTEEIFATERLCPEKTPRHPELWARFRGGSTPDDNIPTASQIRDVLASGRQQLLETLGKFTDDQLSFIPPALKERGLTMHDVLHILSWHEAHHQGQSHITLNLFLNRA